MSVCYKTASQLVIMRISHVMVTPVHGQELSTDQRGMNQKIFKVFTQQNITISCLQTL